MKASGLVAGLLLIAGTGAAGAESGGFFKSLLSGNGVGEAPSITAPRARDPDDAYCPPVTVADGAAAFPAGSGTVQHHQVTFSRMSRECKAQGNGALSVKVGVELRALLGPAGAPGKFDTPLTIAIKYNGTVLTARSRRVAVSVPPGAAQGTAAVIEADLTVPADAAGGYDIEVGLAAQARGFSNAPPKVAAKGSTQGSAKRRKPVTQEATATGEAPVSEAPAAGQ